METTDFQKIIESIGAIKEQIKNFENQMETFKSQINMKFENQMMQLKDQTTMIENKMETFENRINVKFQNQTTMIENKMRTFEYQLNMVANRSEIGMAQVGLPEALSAASVIGASPRHINPVYMR